MLDAAVILNHWYKNSDRRVTSDQFKLITDTFQNNPHPLYLKVCDEHSIDVYLLQSINKVRI